MTSPNEDKGMNDEKRAEILAGHYSDTFKIIHEHWKVRNRLFMYALVLMVIIFLDTIALPNNKVAVSCKSNPNTSVATSDKNTTVNSPEVPSKRVKVHRLLSSIANKVAKDKLGLEKDPFDFSIVDLMARFLLLGLVVPYYQRSILVDRQYRYLHYLEKRLAKLMGDDYICREGKAYFSKTGKPDGDAGKSLFVQMIGVFYIYIFPIALIALVLSKFIQKDPFNPVPDVITVILSGMIIVACGLYMRWNIKERKTNSKVKVDKNGQAAE